PKCPQPTPHGRYATVGFSRVNVMVRFIGAAHRSKFEKNEPPAVTADSFLSKKNRTAVLGPDEQSDKHKEWSANDQCYCRGNNIEEPLEVMVGRGASQLKTTLERPKRIDDAQRQIT